MAGFNFFDILIIILIGGAFFGGKKTGLLPGLFFLFGVLTANFFSVHYYAKSGRVIWKWLELSPQYGELIAYFIITGVILALFILVRNGWQALIKTDTPTIYDLIGGITTTVISYVLISGMLFFAVFVFHNDYLVLKARNCLSYRILGKSTVRIYEGLFNFVVAPLFPREKINDKVFKAYSREQKQEDPQETSSSEVKDKK